MNKHAEILNENELRQLSKSIPALFSNKESLPNEAFKNVLHTVRKSNLSPIHGAAAVNTLCSFIDCYGSVPENGVVSPLTNDGFSKELFEIYLMNADNHKSKPAKRLLTTATRLLLKELGEERKASTLRKIVERCINVLLKRDEGASARSSLQIVDHFLNVAFVDAIYLLRIYEFGTPSLDQKNDLEAKKFSLEETSILRNATTNFVQQIFFWVRYPDCAHVIARFLPRFFNSIESFPALKNAEDTHETTLWMEPVKRALIEDPGLLETFENYVLPGLFALKSTDIKSLSKTLPLEDVLGGRYKLCDDIDLHMCLFFAKSLKNDNSNITFPGETRSDRVERASDVANKLSTALLQHSSPNIRIAALSLLISSKSVAVFEPVVLASFRHNLPHFHGEVNPKTRNEFIAEMKGLVYKLKSIIKRLGRSPILETNKQPAASGEVLLKDHMNFLVWYYNFIMAELRPSATYQSHITALKVLWILFDADSYSLLSNPLYTIKSSSIRAQILVRSLVDLLLDPFEDVRQSAASVLEMFYQPDKNYELGNYIFNQRRDELTVALTRASELMDRTGRADHSEGVGRIYNIIHVLEVTQSASQKATNILLTLHQCLDYEIRRLQEGISSAIDSPSLQGLVIALRYIISRVDFSMQYQKYSTLDRLTLRDFKLRLLESCTEVWNAVRSLLCSDAPEGHIIDDEQGDDSQPGSKDALSFSWRALKESSLLMRTLIETELSTVLSNEDALPDVAYESFGNVLFSQLTELRHRGAFSTVAQTFTAWCVACSKSGRKPTMDLPLQWYLETIACIQQRSDALTRRSGGLPSIIVAILAASLNTELFDKALLDLQAIADAPINYGKTSGALRLPQVHALNCLKDIFTDARFGSKTEEYMDTTLSISVSCLESDVWAIRNCGLMLLNALLKRIDGGGDTSSSALSSSRRRHSPGIYRQYPILPGFLLKLLRGDSRHPFQSVVNAQRVFPALEVVERFGLPEMHRVEILTALKNHQASTTWSIREKAAKAMGLVVEPLTFIQEIGIVLSNTSCLQNELHGRLLCLGHLLRRLKSEPHQDYCLQDELSKICSLSAKLITSTTVSPVNKFTYLNILNEFGLKIPEQQLPEIEEHYRSYFLNPGRICTGPMAVEKETWIKYQQLNCANLPQPIPLGGPLRYEYDLKMLGVKMAEDFATTVDYSKLQGRVSTWIRALFLALIEHSDFPTRFAAVSCIQNFGQTLHKSHLRPTAAPEPFELLPVLYTILVDDDEDIRGLGAKIVSLWISKDESKRTGRPTSLSLTPPAAKSKLLEYLRNNYRHTPSLLIESIWRMTGMDKRVDLGLRVKLIGSSSLMTETLPSIGLQPVSALLGMAMKEQNVVFEEEKQNLYLDPVSEADAWAETVLLVDEASWPPGLTLQVEKWVTDGLTCLASTVKAHGDGLLGLTSKDDVFTLFAQVISVTRVLLQKGCHSSLPTMPRGEHVLESLRMLEEVGKKNELHPLLLDRISNLL